MTMGLTRRGFLGTAQGTCGAAALFGITGTSVLGSDRSGRSSENHSANESVAPGFPSQDSATVFEMVVVSHHDIDRVRKLVEGSPALAKASWDWGFGDWESALGAASHSGRIDIAELLIRKGARPNLFTFALMGNLKAVRAIVESTPGVQRIAGPHGISLLSHAVKGFARSKDKQTAQVIDYLKSLGDADPAVTNLAMPDEKIYLGRYSFGEGSEDVLEVTLRSRGQLAIERGDTFYGALNCVEEHGFAPSGAPAVRVRFNIKNGRAASLTVHDPAPLVTATRIG